MAPRRARFMPGATARVKWKAPSRLIAKISRQSVSETSSTGRHAARGVHEHVDPSGRGLHARHERAHRLRIAHVHHRGLTGPAPDPIHRPARRFELGRAHVAGPHERALAGQLGTDGAADAVRGTGHDGHPAVEAHG